MNHCVEDLNIIIYLMKYEEKEYNKSKVTNIFGAQLSQELFYMVIEVVFDKFST